MRCEECDFWHRNGGDCRGYIKNPAGLSPFYICPHQAERESILEYWSRTAAELCKGIHNPPFFLQYPLHASDSCPVPD